MEFLPVTIRGQDGAPITRDLAILRITENCLAVQRSPLVGGSPCYEAVHIPTGGIMTKYAFLDPEDCRDALVDYWTRLTMEQRTRLIHADVLDMLTDRDLMRPFQLAFVEKANLIIDAPQESEAASG